MSTSPDILRIPQVVEALTLNNQIAEGGIDKGKGVELLASTMANLPEVELHLLLNTLCANNSNGR
jgi:hypothetical protein